MMPYQHHHLLKDNYEKFEQAQAQALAEQQAIEKGKLANETLRTTGQILDKPSNIQAPVPQEEMQQANGSIKDKILNS